MAAQIAAVGKKILFFVFLLQEHGITWRKTDTVLEEKSAFSSV